MENFLRVLLLTGAVNEIDNPSEHDDPDKTPRFRGANTPNFYEGKFTMDSSSHCPRIAILRKYGVSEIPSTKSLLSWHYGRSWEEKVKKWIDLAGYPGLSYTEEEECLVEFYSYKDETERVYTARPDLLVEYNGDKFPVEIKSSQSDNVAKKAFLDGQPKLGAIQQLNAAMAYHGCEYGFTLYGLMHWVSGYDFSSKQRFKIQPDLVTHYITRLDSGAIAVGGVKSVVSLQGLSEGLALLEALDDEGVLPSERPVGVDVFGNPFSYNICNYCEFNPVCSQYTKNDKIDIEEFIDSATMECNVCQN